MYNYTCSKLNALEKGRGGTSGVRPCGFPKREGWERGDLQAGSEVKLAQSCPTLWRLFATLQRGSPGQNTGVGSLSVHPGDLPNTGIEPRAPALRLDSLPAEPQGSERIIEWVAYPFSRGSSRSRNQTGVSCHCRRILYHWATYIGRKKSSKTWSSWGEHSDRLGH